MKYRENVRLYHLAWKIVIWKKEKNIWRSREIKKEGRNHSYFIYGKDGMVQRLRYIATGIRKDEMQNCTLTLLGEDH